MGQTCISNNYKFDDGLIYLHHNQVDHKITVFLNNYIDNEKTLSQELAEILTYVSTYRPEKIILVLNSCDNFFRFYPNINLSFFEILKMLGIKKIGFVIDENKKDGLQKIIKENNLEYAILHHLNDSSS